MKKKLLIFFLLFSVIMFSCKNSEEHHTENIEKHENKSADNPLKIDIPDEKYKVGDIIKIDISCDSISETDTVFLKYNSKQIATLSKTALKYELNTQNSKVGKNWISLECTKNGKNYSISKNVSLISDIVPKEYTYKVKKVYKHDVQAYVQGLFYKDGFLYEATGLKGESSIRKVNLNTGEVLQSYAVDKEIFGEGITYFDNKIVQLSWQNERGFVYNFENFELISEFSYPGEGWGLVYDGKNLIMSNGTPEMLVIDPNSLSVIDQFEVYDNKGPVKFLNELEYINGEIYANIYQYSKIAIIEPATGKVKAYIDLEGILPMNDYNQRTDVLNGIAYDEQGKRLFVTGKLWPKLFEIELVIKN